MNTSNKERDVEKIFDEVTEFLRQLSWRFDSISMNKIKALYQGEFGLKEVHICIDWQEVKLVINPIIEPVDDIWGSSVRRLVTDMKEQIKHMDLGMDDRGSLYLSVGLPPEYLTLERFHAVLLGLCQVAENIVIPILQANAFDNLKTVGL